MTRATQGTGGPGGRPLCWNGTAPENFLVQDGWEPGITPQGNPTRYPRMVEVPSHFSRDCKSWVADPSTDPVPLAENWRCGGCQHFPEDHVQRALDNRAARYARSTQDP